VTPHTHLGRAQDLTREALDPTAYC
jgi:hypothetical protein